LLNTLESIQCKARYQLFIICTFLRREMQHTMHKFALNLRTFPNGATTSEDRTHVL